MSLSLARSRAHFKLYFAAAVAAPPCRLRYTSHTAVRRNARVPTEGTHSETRYGRPAHFALRIMSENLEHGVAERRRRQADVTWE